MDVYKILVVGAQQSGKSSLITSFFNCEALTDKHTKQIAFTKTLGTSNNANSMMDFVLKIINIRGKKARV